MKTGTVILAALLAAGMLGGCNIMSPKVAQAKALERQAEQMVIQTRLMERQTVALEKIAAREGK